MKGGTKYILLVDDDAMLRKTYTRLIGQTQHKVVAQASCASEAVLAFEAHPNINTILSDVQMSQPGKRGEDGHDLLERIHTGLERRNGQFIAMTGSHDPMTRAPFLKYGIPVLLKPFEMHELLVYLQ